jgi:hypothetical protein
MSSDLVAYKKAVRITANPQVSRTGRPPTSSAVTSVVVRVRAAVLCSGDPREFPLAESSLPQATGAKLF